MRWTGSQLFSVWRVGFQVTDLLGLFLTNMLKQLIDNTYLHRLIVITISYGCKRDQTHTQMFKRTLKCSNAHSNVQMHTQMFKRTLKCSNAN